MEVVYFLYFLKRGDPDELFKGTDGNFQKLYAPTVRDRHISDVHPDKPALQVRQCHTGVHFLFVMIQPQLDAVRDFVEVTKFDLFYDVRGNLFNYTHKSDLLVFPLYHIYTARQTCRQRMNYKFTLRYNGYQTGTAVLTLKIVDETEGILYTYSKEYVVEPTQNRDFLTLSDIQAVTNGNTKLGALANTNVYLDASLEAISVENRCTNVLVQVFDSAGNRMLSSKVGLGTSSKSLKGTLSDGWGSTNAFSRLNSSLDFTPSQAGTYTVYVYAFDDSGFLLGKWNTRISVQ